MRVSFVLRLDAEALAADHLVGQVEAVAAGVVAAINSPDELLAFCRAQAQAMAPDRTAGLGPASKGSQ